MFKKLAIAFAAVVALSGCSQSVGSIDTGAVSAAVAGDFATTTCGSTTPGVVGERRIIVGACPGGAKTWLHPLTAEVMNYGYAVVKASEISSGKRDNCLYAKPLSGDKVISGAPGGALRANGVFMYGRGAPIMVIELVPGACASLQGSQYHVVSVDAFVMGAQQSPVKKSFGGFKGASFG